MWKGVEREKGCESVWMKWNYKWTGTGIRELLANKISAGSKRKGFGSRYGIWKLRRRFGRGGEEGEGRTNYEDQVNNIKSERASLSLFFEKKTEEQKGKKTKQWRQTGGRRAREYESAETQVEKPFSDFDFPSLLRLLCFSAMKELPFPSLVSLQRCVPSFSCFSYRSNTLASFLPITIIKAKNKLNFFPYIATVATHSSLLCVLHTNRAQY